MKALKSLLNKDSSSLKTLGEKKTRKYTKRSKNQTPNPYYRPNQLGDNYEPQDMDIDPPLTTHYPAQAQPAPDYQNFMQNFFNIFQMWLNQTNYNQMSSMNGYMSNQTNYTNFIKRPIKKFKKTQIKRNLNKKKIFKPKINTSSNENASVQEEAVRQDVPLFTFNDVDERFLDTTTTTLDIDYRQLNVLELLKPVDKSELEKDLKEVKSDDEDQSDNEVELMNLRKNLLDTMNQKRSLKKQQEQEQIDLDISLLKKKLAEHEQALIEADQKDTNKAKANQIARQSFKIDPIVIRIGQNESSDEESDESTSVEQNIGEFSNEAKQIAAQTSLKRKASDLDLSEGDNRNEEKKDMIKSLRDRINLKR